MMDTIRICTNITAAELETKKWKMKVNKKTGEFYYYAFINSIRLAFYPNSNNLIITGRYISVYTKSKFKNFDDIFSTRNEIFEFFFYLECCINSFFVVPVVNILHDKVTRIDYCINIRNENTKKYIEFFNLYHCKDSKKHQRYVNHTTKLKLPMDSSCYIKTSKQYEKGENKNFTLNIYCKEDELFNKRAEQISKYGRSSITDRDILEAKDIMRIEIQLHHFKLKSICKKFKINWKTRCLYDLFNMDIARYVISNELNRFFTDADFYSYQKAKEEINSKIKNYKSRKSALEYIEAVAKNNNVTSSTIPKRLLEIGIFPYMFIPKDWNIDILENPTKLVDEKISSRKLQNLSLKERKN